MNISRMRKLFLITRGREKQIGNSPSRNFGTFSRKIYTFYAVDYLQFCSVVKPLIFFYRYEKIIIHIFGDDICGNRLWVKGGG